jgi:hypothetical protein
VAITFRVPEPVGPENRPDAEGPGGSCLVAGVRYEAQHRKRGRQTEVVRVRFEGMGSAFVPLQGDRGQSI